MTSKEVTEYLRVRPRTIYRLAKSGQISSRKVGKGWRFKKERVDSYLSETKYSASRGKRVQRSERKIQPVFDKSYEGKDQSSL
jgi:excisionase family DNA binding protein